jgi:hypothetical protein
MKAHVLQQDSLLAIWRTLGVRGKPADALYELSAAGDLLVRDEDPWHQILKTDVFCQLATQLGPRVALHLPVVTRTFGVRVPDVVWMPDEKWPDDDAGQATNPWPSPRTCAWRYCSAMPSARPLSTAGLTPTCAAEQRK